jgi:hypothetical protein
MITLWILYFKRETLLNSHHLLLAIQLLGNITHQTLHQPFFAGANNAKTASGAEVGLKPTRLVIVFIGNETLLRD